MPTLMKYMLFFAMLPLIVPAAAAFGMLVIAFMNALVLAIL